MKSLRNALLGAVGGLGATVLTNRLLRPSGDFEPFLDDEQGTYRWRGFDVAYTELGDPEDPDLFLFHGVSAAASSHEFAQVVDELRTEYHLIIPDLPGFGHSDRPPLLYSASLYTTFVADAIEDLSNDDPIVVASSLTGSYAAAAAVEVDVERLVLVCPTDTTAGEPRFWLRSLLRSPVVGEGLFNLLVSRGSLRYFNTDHGYFDPGAMSEAVLEYEWQSAHQPGARFAPASFVSGFLDPDEPLEETLGGVDAPVTIVWGRNSEIVPLSEGRAVAEAADTELVVFDQAKLLPHAEHPEEFGSVVRGNLTPER